MAVRPWYVARLSMCGWPGSWCVVCLCVVGQVRGVWLVGLTWLARPACGWRGLCVAVRGSVWFVLCGRTRPCVASGAFIAGQIRVWLVGHV